MLRPSTAMTVLEPLFDTNLGVGATGVVGGVKSLVNVMTFVKSLLI